MPESQQRGGKVYVPGWEFSNCRANMKKALVCVAMHYVLGVVGTWARTSRNYVNVSHGLVWEQVVCS